MWMKFQFARGVVKHTSLFLLYLHVQYSTYLSVRGKHEEVKVYDGRLFLYSSKWAFASCMRFSAASYCGYNEAHKPHCTCKAISWKLLLILTGGVIFSCFHAHTHTDAPMRCLPPWVQARVQYMWGELKLLGTPEVARGVAEGQWSAGPQSQRWWLLCGYSEIAPTGCRVRAPETTGALSSNVTNTTWHIGACSRTSPPFTHSATFFLPPVSFFGTQTPGQTGTDINTKKTPKQ